MPAPNRPRVKEAIDRFIARVRHNIEVHLETLASDLVKAVEEDGGSVSDRLAELAKAASAIQAQEGKLDVIAQLVAALRQQDEANTLRGILEALAKGCSAETARVAVLLVSGETLHSFVDHGYLAGAKPVDTPLDSYAALSGVIRDRQRLLLAGPAGGRGPDVPPFMRAMSGNSGVVVPVIVANSVVAVIYAEGQERVAGQRAPSIWMEHVEVLVRHASSRLENLTSRRTVEVLTSTG